MISSPGSDLDRIDSVRRRTTAARRIALIGAAVVAAMSFALPLPSAAAAVGGPPPAQTFGTTGSVQIATVPDGAEGVTVSVSGAAGSRDTSGKAVAGNGALITGLLRVQPGEQLELWVGERPSSSSGANGAGGWGWGSGGSGGGGGLDVRSVGGGGASAISRDGLTLAVSGGGGGAGIAGIGSKFYEGGDGGNAGATAQSGGTSGGKYGGAGGIGSASSTATGTNGGSSHGAGGGQGGGGGGGVLGGGGGHGGSGNVIIESGGGGGGGAGSSMVDPTLLGGIVSTAAVPGDGQIVLTWISDLSFEVVLSDSAPSAGESVSLSVAAVTPGGRTGLTSGIAFTSDVATDKVSGASMTATVAGIRTISARSAGALVAQLAVTVTPGAVSSGIVIPSSPNVVAGGTVWFTVYSTDAWGNRIADISSTTRMITQTSSDILYPDHVQFFEVGQRQVYALVESTSICCSTIIEVTPASAEEEEEDTGSYEDPVDPPDADVDDSLGSRPAGLPVARNEGRLAATGADGLEALIGSAGLVAGGATILWMTHRGRRRSSPAAARSGEML